MKKIILGMLALSFAASTLMANSSVAAKKLKVKQATCTSCVKGQKCAKSVCTKADCCQ